MPSLFSSQSSPSLALFSHCRSSFWLATSAIWKARCSYAPTYLNPIFGVNLCLMHLAGCYSRGGPKVRWRQRSHFSWVQRKNVRTNWCVFWLSRGENVEDAFLETAKKIFQHVQDGKCVHSFVFLLITFSWWCLVLTGSVDLNAAESGVQAKAAGNGGFSFSPSFLNSYRTPLSQLTNSYISCGWRQGTSSGRCKRGRLLLKSFNVVQASIEALC